MPRKQCSVFACVWVFGSHLRLRNPSREAPGGPSPPALLSLFFEMHLAASSLPPAVTARCTVPYAPLPSTSRISYLHKGNAIVSKRTSGRRRLLCAVGCASEEGREGTSEEKEALKQELHKQARSKCERASLPHPLLALLSTWPHPRRNHRGVLLCAYARRQPRAIDLGHMRFKRALGAVPHPRGKYTHEKIGVTGHFSRPFSPITMATKTPALRCVSSSPTCTHWGAERFYTTGTQLSAWTCEGVGG
jgi:hypothetical protein